MRPNTYVHQPHAHHGHRRPMARRIMDVPYLGSIPRRNACYTQDAAQIMAHAAMAQRLHARHCLQYRTYLHTHRNRLCRIPRPLNGNSWRHAYTDYRKYALGYATADSLRLSTGICSHHYRLAASHEPPHMDTTTTAHIHRLSRHIASHHPCPSHLCRHPDTLRRPRPLCLPPILTRSIHHTPPLPTDSTKPSTLDNTGYPNNTALSFS